MSKNKRIKKTQKAVQHCVDKAENVLKATLNLCQEKQNSISSLEQYQQQYQQQMLKQGSVGLSAWQLQQLDGFLHQLNGAVAVEKVHLSNLQHQADQKRLELTKQQVKKTAVDNLSQRYQQKIQLQQDKHEQTELDDLSVSRSE